jgi:3-methylfumaryl-CoA hydratase
LDLAAIEATLRQAIGCRAVIEDYVAPVMAARLAATLEVDAPSGGEALPPGWHMIFCLEVPSRSELDTDGLPRGFALIPPVDMSRRMFGGARLSLHAPLTVGQPLRCESELADAKMRSTATRIWRLRHYAIGSLAPRDWPLSRSRISFTCSRSTAGTRRPRRRPIPARRRPGSVTSIRTKSRCSGSPR